MRIRPAVINAVNDYLYLKGRAGGIRLFQGLIGQTRKQELMGAIYKIHKGEEVILK